MMDVTAIIVTYNPNVDILLKNINSLKSSLYIKKIILVDNSETYALDLLENINEVSLMHLGYNSGIAYAQNKGLLEAKKNGSKFAILFDQDSYIEKDLIEKLVSGFFEIKNLGYKIAAVGPRPYDIFETKKSRPIIQKDSAISDKFSICKQIIASGKLIDLSILDEVGFMEDNLFIDGVDHEWCWRAATKGYYVVIVENAVMHHTLGDARGKFFGITYKIGSPIRLYYQFRNTLLLSRRKYVPFYWKIRCISSIFIRFFIFSLLCDKRLLRVKYMIKGISHGVINKYGSY